MLLSDGEGESDEEEVVVVVVVVGAPPVICLARLLWCWSSYTTTMNLGRSILSAVLSQPHDWNGARFTFRGIFTAT